jgi:integrase
MRRDVKGIRDCAIVLVAYAGALRRSEVAYLDLCDVQFTTEGVVLTLTRSKTDQDGIGVKVAIKAGNRAYTCPVRALTRWIETADVSEGALFRPVTKGGSVGTTRLSDKTVCTVFKEFAILLGLNPADFGGHSGRAGVITDGFAASIAQAVIAKHSRHKSNVIGDYLREATLFDQNLSGLVGL